MRGLAVVLGALLCVSLGVNVAQATQTQQLRAQADMQRQRELADVVSAMADIEVNLAKLRIASGIAQSVSLLGETAMLAQHAQSGLSRLPLSGEAAADAMKFTGQVGDYARTLAERVGSGRMLTTGDEKQLEAMMTACRALNEHLSGLDADWTPDVPLLPAEQGDSAIPYPSLIYDGPFSDGHAQGKALGLTGARVTREQAREAAARYAGVTADRVRDGADSGGTFEAFGFVADTPDGRLSVQVTGQGGHLLWMVPEQAEYAAVRDEQACLQSAQVYLTDCGFGAMESCFVQTYDGMVVANFAAVQDGVLLYPDQVKVQVSRDSGRVVGAECTQYWANHTRRENLTPSLSAEAASSLLSARLNAGAGRLCVIPDEAGERLCWEFAGTADGAQYRVYLDAHTGEAAQILRVMQTQDGEAAL